MNKLAGFSISCAGLVVFSALQGAEIPATGDTWVHGATATRDINYGGGEFMKIREHNGRTALIQFDPSALPPGADTDTLLSLHVARVLVGGAVQIRRVTSPWTESTVTFNTRPTHAPEVYNTRTIAPGDTGTRVTFNISSLVQEWLADPQANMGLAITAEAPTDVYFGTRNVDTPPLLVITVRNTVTVSKNGGDYSNPIAAANNAYSGHTWCVGAVPPVDPCVMNIGEGIFILPETFVTPDDVVISGFGKTATTLVAAKGLEVAVEAHTNTLSHLTIINRQDSSVGRALGLRVLNGNFGASTLTSVAVRAEGAIDNVGLEAGNNDGTTLVESDISAAGGETALAIDGDQALSAIDIYDSRITATGAAQDNTGLSRFMDNNGDVWLTDTVVVAMGGRQAWGVSVSDEEGGLDIRGGTITASAQERAGGAVGGESTSGMTISGTRVVTESPGEAVGIGWYGVGNELIVDGVFVHSSGVALSRDLERLGTLNVMRSQLIGSTRAIEILRNPFVSPYPAIQAHIESSVLQGEQSIVTAGDADELNVVDSILDGTPEIAGAVASCTNVLDGNHQPLGSDCLPQ